MPTSNRQRGGQASIKKVIVYVAKRCLSRLLEIVAFFVTLLHQPKRATIPPIDDHNLITPAIKLSKQIKSGHITSEEVVESFIARIKRINPIINAVVDKRFEAALKEARDIDRKIAEARNGDGDKSILDLPLLGVPMSVKETIAVNGHSYTGGMLGRRFIKAPENAKSVDLLVKAGLIPIALTNIPEMAMWWDASNPVYGRSLNPYDLSRITGGSSGGEAALLASAGSVVGIGSDIAGSIRMPCHFCGVFGHKPTPFVVSNVGMYPFVKGEREKLLGVGPMCRYASDLKPMLKIMADDKASKLNLDQPVDLNNLKLFYLEDIGDPLVSKCSPDILSGMTSVIEHFLSKYKVTAQKVTIEEFKYGMFLWYCEANVKDAPSMATQINDGRCEMNPFVELAKKIFNLSEHTLHSILGVFFEKLSPTYGTSLHTHLSQRANEMREKFNDLVGDNGVLLMPCHPEAAPAHGTTMIKALNVAYTGIATTLLSPITQCPLGMNTDGLPYGIQVIAKPYNDRYTLAVAEEIEIAFGGWQPPCRIAVE